MLGLPLELPFTEESPESPARLDSLPVLEAATYGLACNALRATSGPLLIWF